MTIAGLSRTTRDDKDDVFTYGAAICDLHKVVLLKLELSPHTQHITLDKHVSLWPRSDVLKVLMDDHLDGRVCPIAGSHRWNLEGPMCQSGDSAYDIHQDAQGLRVQEQEDAAVVLILFEAAHHWVRCRVVVVGDLAG